LLNRDIWLELRKKRKVYDLWKKRQAAQDDYKGIVRLCRKKVLRVKAQVELSLPTPIKDNKNVFINTLATKGG